MIVVIKTEIAQMKVNECDQKWNLYLSKTNFKDLYELLDQNFFLRSWEIQSNVFKVHIQNSYSNFKIQILKFENLKVKADLKY